MDFRDEKGDARFYHDRFVYIMVSRDIKEAHLDVADERDLCDSHRDEIEIEAAG